MQNMPSLALQTLSGFHVIHNMWLQKYVSSFQAPCWEDMDMSTLDTE